jgi:YfdX protein
MLGKTFVAVVSVLSLLLPAASFAQAGQQQGQQQTPSQLRQDQQTQQSPSRPSQGQQQQERITADVQVSPQGQLSEEERRALSMAAGRLLKHVHQGRQAINQQQTQQAIGHIDKGLTLVQIIENAVPTYQVTARIQSGNAIYEEKEQVKQLMVPIYAELEKVTLMAPLMAAKQEAAQNGGAAHGSMAGKQSQQPSTEQSSQPSRAAMTPVVAGVELHHTHIMFDVSAAKEHLQAAKQALNNDKYKAADGALAAVQRGVNFAHVEVDLPLLRARENLMLAKAHVQAGQVQDARMTLEAVTQALQQYEQRADKARASQVQSLQKEIQNYAQQLPQQGQQTQQKNQQAVEQINEWWDRIVQLSDQA